MFPASPVNPLPGAFRRAWPALAFVVLYLLFDWATYVDPMYGLNITPWNPEPALGLVFWLHYGRRAALPWFAGLLAGELLVRGMPAGPWWTLVSALWLTLGYGLIGAALRRRFGDGNIFDNRFQLVSWIAIVVAGLWFNDVVYIGLLSWAGLIPAGHGGAALLRFGTGDCVGVLVSMPLLWMLASADGRLRLRAAVWRWESAGYLALTLLVLWSVFGPFANPEFRHFYYFFMPVVWAASRQGLRGAALMLFVVQLGIFGVVKWTHVAEAKVFQLQMLDAVLALVGLFIGIIVDELVQLGGELKQSLRLAAAGEMTAALAHELNQPLTALATYGKACEYLLERGDRPDMLKDTIGRMVLESNRAADVVRRLRDFFRTGAMRLESVPVAALLADAAAQFTLACREQQVALVLGQAPALAVQADRLQIALVLRNLLANALDAVVAQPPGARRITLSAQRLDGGRLQLSVDDSGTGVTAALALRLFEPFASTKASGLGLGLVLSRAIVEAHGGHLWAEVGPHGMFRVALPLAEMEADDGQA